MIQPLGSLRGEWLVYWHDFDEPVFGMGGAFLPTLVLVANGQVGGLLCPPLVLEELDQPRVENMLLRLFDHWGAPERLIVRASEDWNEEAWREFSSEQKVEMCFQPMNPKSVAALVKGFLSSIERNFFREAGGEKAALAAQLVESALRLSSSTKRRAVLRKALYLDTECSAARVELADMDFHEGNWSQSLKGYEETIRREAPRWSGVGGVKWWLDRETRPYLRALYGRALVIWQEGRYAEAAGQLRELLEMNPVDNQGARFFLPLLFLLAEDLGTASRSYREYEEKYPNDYPEPGFLFGWGLCNGLEGDEMGARRRYREAICRNIYIAPLLLDELMPERGIWMPNERAEPGYAQEFYNSYAALWDREAGLLRILREVWDEMRPWVRAIVGHRGMMLDWLDQRYEPEFKARWQELLDEDDRLVDRGCSGSF